MDWETPWSVVHAVAHLLNIDRFDLDPAADPDNAKADDYISLLHDRDGLAESWWGNVWLNPPYGREIGAWVAKAAWEATHNRKVNLVAALVTARTDTHWWHDHVSKASTVMLLKGRIRFVDAEASAPFPSAVVVWKREPMPAPTRYMLVKLGG